jgi:D-alanine-D-alanine ligase-like ATP-grasp enzyme
MNLRVADVGLRRTPEDLWYCFEVNPSPGFTYYQVATRQPIDEAIARLLVAGLGT